MILHIKEADMDKFIYVEPAEYINDEMKKILEKGENMPESRIKAVLFPCDFFSINEVDSSYQAEYDAVVSNGNFDIYFYNYDEFIEEGILHLNRRPAEKTPTLLRGWMLSDKRYDKFYHLLKERNIELTTTPEQYAAMHLFPKVYPLISEDTPGLLVYPDGCGIDLAEIKSKFSRFMVKDYVKSEKGTDFPKFFDSSISDEDFYHWITVFKEYRGKLFTGGICIKEFVDLKRYNDNTNEWRVFYAGGKVISISRNSGQKNSKKEVPKALVDKYALLPSPFYTVDFAELADGNWKIIEAGDGQVSGLSEKQDAAAFFRFLEIYL